MLHLPKGLEVVGDGWFIGSDIQNVFIPNTVRELGGHAFDNCRGLREVVFEPGSQLETIGKCCFRATRLARITIPKSVRDIGDYAFNGCFNLCSLRFEEGSQLAHVGKDIVCLTPLDQKYLNFPSTAQIDDY